MPLATGTRLGPYEVLALIGAGGMGEVYKARDTRLDRTVAVKVLPPELASDLERHARFEHEARAIASLDHPHICTLYDVGAHEGAPFLVMEYLAGETLAEHMREGPLALPEVLDVGAEIADALDAAHGNGVVHRDLKPHNVVVTKNGIKLLDFGLAKHVPRTAERARVEARTAAAVTLATGLGVTAGTLAYMSPEQALGKDLDARTDLFSLGVVLYEMATGRLPFLGDTSAAVIDNLLHQAPTSPVRLNPDVPEALERIITKALEKDREVRYQSARDLLADLARLKRERESGRSAAQTAGATASVPSLAVLPFANLSADKENEYFSDGLAEDIIDALAQVPGLRVMARTSAFAFRGKEQDVRDIGARLNVEHILEGSVRKAGNRIRVTAQLVKARDGYHLWSQRFDREMTDVFAIQDEISQAIVEKLRVQLASDGPLVRRRAANVDAYNLYLKARYQFWRFTPEALAKSKEYYEQAVASDPNYAQAWYGLAGFYHLLGLSGLMPPKVVNAQADQATRRALQLDDLLAEAHALMGALRASEFDWKAAELEFNRALELDPRSGDVLRWYEHYYLGPMKRQDEALAAYLRAVERDPLSPSLQAQLGYVYCLKREWDRAIAQCRTAFELDPQCWAYILLGACCFHIGRHDDAVRAAETQAQMMGRSSFALGGLGWTYASTGRTAEALKVLEELQERAQQQYTPSWSFAVVHSGLGEMDTAFDWYEKAVDEREPLMLQFNVHPNYDPLRTHPRYPALLRKMNLEP